MDRDLRIRYLQDTQGGLLDTDLSVGDVFYDDRDHELDDRTVLVVQFPPSEEDLRNPLRCASLVPESSAVPGSLASLHKRRYEGDPGYARDSGYGHKDQIAEKRPRLGESSFGQSRDPDRPIASREGRDDGIAPNRFSQHVASRIHHTENSYPVMQQSSTVGGQKQYLSHAHATAYVPYGTPVSSSIHSPKPTSRPPDHISIPDSPMPSQQQRSSEHHKATHFEPVSPKSESPELATSINDPRPLGDQSRDLAVNHSVVHEDDMLASPVPFDEIERVFSSVPQEDAVNHDPDSSIHVEQQDRGSPSHSVSDGDVGTKEPAEESLGSPSRLSPPSRHGDHESPLLWRRKLRKGPASPESLKIINGVRQRARSVVRPSTAATRRADSTSDAGVSVRKQVMSGSSLTRHGSRDAQTPSTEQNSKPLMGKADTAKRGGDTVTSAGSVKASDVTLKNKAHSNSLDREAPLPSMKSAQGRFEAASTPAEKLKSKSSKADGNKEELARCSSSGQPAGTDIPTQLPVIKEGPTQRNAKSGRTSMVNTETLRRSESASIREAAAAENPPVEIDVVQVDDLRNEPWVQALLHKSDKKSEQKRNQKLSAKNLRQNTNFNARAEGSPIASVAVTGASEKKRNNSSQRSHTQSDDLHLDDETSTDHRTDFSEIAPNGIINSSRPSKSKFSKRKSNHATLFDETSKDQSPPNQDSAIELATSERKDPATTKPQTGKVLSEQHVEPASTPKKRSITPVYPGSSMKRTSALKRPSMHPARHSKTTRQGPENLSSPQKASPSSPSTQRRSVSWPDDPVLYIDDVDDRKIDPQIPMVSMSGKRTALKDDQKLDNNAVSTQAPTRSASNAGKGVYPNASASEPINEAVELSSDSEKSMSPFISGDEEDGFEEAVEEVADGVPITKAGPKLSQPVKKTREPSLAEIIVPKQDRVQLSRGSRSPAEYIAGDVDQDSSAGSQDASSSITGSSETEMGSTSNMSSRNASQTACSSGPQDGIDGHNLDSFIKTDNIERASDDGNETRSHNHSKSTSTDREASEQLLRESQASMPTPAQPHNESMKATISPGTQKGQVTPSASRFPSLSQLKYSRQGQRLASARTQQAQSQPTRKQLSESEDSETESSEEDNSDAGMCGNRNDTKNRGSRSEKAFKTLMKSWSINKNGADCVS